MKWRCLLRILCPLRSPITTLDFVLLKNECLVLALRLGPEINSRSLLWVLPRPRHLAHSWLSNQRRIFLRIFCQETPQRRLRSDKLPNGTISCELDGNFVSSYPQHVRIDIKIAQNKFWYSIRSRGGGFSQHGVCGGLIYAILLVYNMLISQMT